MAAFGLLPMFAASAERFDLTQASTDPRWKIEARTASVVDVKGKKALKMSEGPGMGLFWLPGFEFSNGTIEVDLLGRSQPVQGSFVGIAFRVNSLAEHDAVYFRPFNFRATDPDRHSHAVQYVSHPQWSWQKLRAERTGQFEKPISPELDGDEWFHVRVEVNHPVIRVFVNNESKPCLEVNELTDRTKGSIGLWVGEGSGGHFANLAVTKK